MSPNGRCAKCGFDYLDDDRGCDACSGITGKFEEIDLVELIKRQAAIIKEVQVRSLDAVKKARKHENEDPRFWASAVADCKDMSLAISHVTKNRLSLEKSATETVAGMTHDQKIDLFKVLLAETPREHLDTLVQTMTMFIREIQRQEITHGEGQRVRPVQ